MFPHTITLFNYVNSKHYRHVINGVYWYGSKIINMQGNGFVNSDQVNIVIPKEKLNNYISKKQYLQLADDEKEEYFTIQKGDKVVKGEIDDIQSINDLNKYDDVITIISYDINDVDSELNNILIGGK